MNSQDSARPISRFCRPHPVWSVILLLVSVLGLSSPGLALEPTKNITQYIHDVWQDELPQVSVLTVAQTKDGYLWLGTYEGLVRFDGIQFSVVHPQNLNIPKSNGVFSLFEDSQGRLWIGTVGGGLLCLKDGQFSGYSIQNGLPDNSVRAICEDQKGNIWIGTEDGLGLLENGKIRVFTTQDGLGSNVIRTLCCDRSGKVWIGTIGGLSCFENGAFTCLTTNQGLLNNRVNAIYEDLEHTIWVGTEGGGLSRWQNGHFQNYTVQQGLASNIILSVLEDRDGNLWIGTDGGGLNRLKKDGTIARFSSKDGLSQNAVRSLFEDREGSLWVGTSSGLNRLRDGKFVTYTVQDGLSNNYLRTILEDRQGTIWLGSEGGGLTSFRDGAFTSYTTEQGLASNLVRTACEDPEGNIWVGTNTGLSCLKNGIFATYTTKDGLANDNLYVIYCDRAGRIWIGTAFAGLNVYENGRFRTYTTKDGLANNSVRAIFEDRQGGFWIGTNSGLSYFKDGIFKNYTTQSGIINDRVFAFYEDTDGSIWMGTNGGLAHFSQGQFTNYTTRDGLFDDVAFQILEDNQGQFWMGCNKGLYCVPKRAFAQLDRREIGVLPCVSYGKTDGMRTNQCNGGSQPSAWKTRNGNLWFPTAKGAVVIDPRSIKLNQLAPPVVIETVVQGSEKFAPSHFLTFEPGENRFEFRYAGLSYLAPEKVRFKCKLEGFDPTWVDVGTRRVAYYTNLPARTYTFRVMACNNDGVWNEVGTSFTFRLKPPLWQTWWAYTIYLLTILAIIYASVQWRMNQLHQRALLLESKVDERTQELAQANRQLQSSQKETLWKNEQLLVANQEVERKNEQLDRKNRELDTKIAELAKKNEELLASQKQADRIFSALAEALPGTLLDGKYRLDEKIGSGGFGAVFRATHLGLNRPVAIKVFKPKPGNDSPEAIERFRREGISTCRVNHPNAITVLDSSVSSEGIAYLVMELLEGHTLTSELQRAGRLSLKRCAEIMIPVCHVLDEAHRAGLIHRDIKPDNIYLHQAKEGEVVKVLDFGIAKLMDDTDESTLRNLTETGGIVGTPTYMSPERLKGDDYDGRADVYSLGIVLYEMLSGRVPFQPSSRGVVEVMLKHLNHQPPSLRDTLPDLPTSVEFVVMASLRKVATDRPNAIEFGNLLSRAVAESLGVDQEIFYRSGPITAPLPLPTQQLDSQQTSYHHLAHAETLQGAFTLEDHPTIVGNQWAEDDTPTIISHEPVTTNLISEEASERTTERKLTGKLLPKEETLT